MLDSISCNLPCQKAQFEEASYSPYVRASLVALGALSFLISMLVFYRVPGLNSLGMSGGWSFFGFGFATLLAGVLVRCKERPRPFDLLPDETVIKIFSYLDIPTLGKLACVSQEWNRLQNEEVLWKELCLRVTESPKPSIRNWKNQYILLNNWTKRHEEVSSYYEDAGYARPVIDFTLLENGTAIEVYPSRWVSQGNRYNIRCLSEDMHFNSINLKDNELRAAYFYKKTWALLLAGGDVRCYDVTTGECTHSFSPPERVRSMLQYIYCNETDAVLHYNNSIVIWNLNGAKEPLIIESPVEVFNFYSTPNFVIVRPAASSNVGVGLVLLSKNDQIMLGIDEHIASVSAVEVSGPYVSFITGNGDLKVYKDDGTEIKLLRTIESALVSNIKTGIKIFGNWVVTINKERLRAWNIDTGRPITEIPFYDLSEDEDLDDAVIENNRLILKYSNEGKISYRLFDFMKDVEEVSQDEDSAPSGAVSQGSLD